MAGQLELRQPLDGHEFALSRDRAPLAGRWRRRSEPRVGSVVEVDAPGDPADGAVVPGAGVVVGVVGVVGVVVGVAGAVVAVPPPERTVVVVTPDATVVVVAAPPPPPPPPPPDGATYVKAWARVIV